MANRNGSTASKDAKGFARFEYFYSLTPPERETYLVELDDPVMAMALTEWLVSKETGIGEAGKIKAPPERNRDLILLDFKPHAILEQLEQLREMVEAGEINGLIFAAKYTKPGKHRHIFGTSGRYSENTDEAIGAAVMLQTTLAQGFTG